MKPPFARRYAFPADDELFGSRALVMGLGLFGGGVAAARFLHSRGASVRVTDLRTAAELASSVAMLRDMPVDLVLGRHRDEDFETADFVVVGPGVPPDSPYLDRAEAAGARLVSEAGLFLARCPARLALVSGSKGKSTTSALIAHVLERAGVPVHLGGNIGRPLLDRVDDLSADDVVVLEISSFQLEQIHGLERRPEVSVLTSLFPVHLDRHGDFGSYARIKREVLEGAATVVLPGDDPLARTFAAGRPGTTVLFGSADRGPADWVVEPGRVRSRRGAVALSLDDTKLLGQHNLRNIAAALAAASALGVDAAVGAEAVRTFEGLPHRLEAVGEVAGVRYLDDSIATTPAALVAALEAVSGPVVLIAGGQDVSGELGDAPQRIAARTRALVAIGSGGERLAEAVARVAPAHPVFRAADMDRAVRTASDLAEEGDLVLLSPGFPSFDAFANFAARGRAFQEAVRALREAWM